MMKNIQMNLKLVLILVANLANLSICFDIGSAQLQSRTAKLIQSTGFLAEDHYIKVQNGQNTLNLVKATNPLINNGRGGLPAREPLLFVHGNFVNANAFILINEGVEPRNYSGRDVGSMSTRELEGLLKNDPGSHSLVFTALNFGYDVWLLNRRTAYDSRVATHFSQAKDDDMNSFRSFNIFDPTNSYNYSFDEQATYDIPETIAYVLQKSGRQKLALIGYSSGVTITLMSLTEKPELANNLSNVILWAPLMDYSLGYLPVFDQIVVFLLPVISQVAAPLPPRFLIPLVEIFTGITCKIDLLRPILCDSILDLLFGKGASQLEAQNLSPENNYLDTTALFEFAQYYQSLKKFRMHHFDFIEPTRNIIAYGQPEPPLYDISKITTNKLSFWVGVADRLGNLRNYELTKQRLTVPIREHFIGGLGVSFNHLGFVLHKKIRELLIIPSLKTIGSR